MKKTILFLFAVAMQVTLFAQKYFPEGTKWTEIRLDREKYDSWYSQVGDEWIPNFETVEYQIQGSYIKDFWKDGDFKTFNCVHTNSTENSDSLFLLLYEGGHDWEDNDWVEVTPYFYDENHMLWPGQAYMFNWEIGTSLYSRTIEASNCTDMDEDGTHEFGMITEIMEGSFGGVKPLKYVEMNGVRIIQGIGVTEWNDGECLFGPVDPYTALCIFQPGMDFEERHKIHHGIRCSFLCLPTRAYDGCSWLRTHHLGRSRGHTPVAEATSQAERQCRAVLRPGGSHRPAHLQLRWKN